MNSNQIKTQRHPFNFYGALLFGFLFLATLGSFVIYIAFLEEALSAQIIMSISGVLICFLACYMVYAYWKNTPTITVDTQYLNVGSQTYSLDRIQKVVLTGKMPFRFIINLPMEGTLIQLKDGTDLVFCDGMYSNSWEVKSFLQHVVLRKNELNNFQLKKISRKELRFIKTEVFKGNQFLSLRGVLLWGIIGLFTYAFIIKSPNLKLGGQLLLSGLILFWVVIHAWMMHYFEISTNYVLVRNHIFFWKMKAYALSDIEEIVFEAEGRRPNCMRIITRDFRNKLYPAGTLRRKTWLEMKKRLESKGIRVRNECIY